MSQGNWGGGGYGQPPGGGGYGPPPGGGGGGGGGGYGQPPGGGGYGQPPGGGGYGQPPGGGGYGPPPGGGGGGGWGGPPPGGPPPGGGGGGGGGWGGPPPGAPPGGGAFGPPGGYGAPPGYGPPGALGTRVQFGGDGGKLFTTYLAFLFGPLIGVYIVVAMLSFMGRAIDGAVGAGGFIALPFSLLGIVLLIAGLVGIQLLFLNKFFEFYYEKLVIDGQPCRYVGDLSGLMKIHLVNQLLTMITFGIYAPWAMVKLKQWTYENVEVGGQRGRLTFDGDGGTLLGTYILGLILTYCTIGIYGPWFANDLFAFFWDNTKIDGRAFSFKKDPGGFFGTYLLSLILTYCTAGIYAPWAMCNIFRWEAERVT